MRLLHHHRTHRRRQLRWVLPAVGALFLVAVVTLVVQYRVSDQAVGTEFFRAHKTIHHTGELLQRGFAIGVGVLTLLLVAIAYWALHATHRIVRPVHALHRALDALGTGDLAVRVALDRGDEFHEVADALNALVARFAETLAKIHALVDEADGIPAHDPDAESRLHTLVRELDRTMDFFRVGPPRVIGERDA